MKSIAEYFRDLAADDRYFGAEPPTPDAEALHRIAEREIQRRVEARVSPNGSGVVLRQSDGAPTETAPAPIPAALAGAGVAAGVATLAGESPEADAWSAAEEEVARQAAEGEARRQAAEEEAARQAEEVAARAAAEAEEAARIAAAAEAARQAEAEEAARQAEAEAARLAEEEKAAEEQRAAEEAAREAEAEEAARRAAAEADAEEAARRAEEEANAAARRAEEAAEEAARRAEEEAEADEAEAAWKAEAEAASAAADEAYEETYEDEADITATEPAPQEGTEGSVLSKLQRLRTTVDNAQALAGDDPVAAFFADAASDGDYEEVLEEAIIAETEDEPDTIANLIGNVTEAAAPALDIDEDDAEDAEIFQPEATAETEEEDKDIDAAAISSLLGSLVHRPVDEDNFEEDEESAAATASEQAAEPMEPETAAEPLVLGAEFADDVPTDGEVAGPEFTVPGDSSLSPEDEADLAAELAEVARESDEMRDAGQTAEAETLDAEDVPLAPAPEKATDDRVSPRRTPSRTAFDDNDMTDTDVAIDRILEKTNNQLESGESSRRRSAIQHLKRAVQVTRADRAAKGKGEDDEESQDEYRRDLARVVRPRRPAEPEGERTQRRLAPLVLVSEQRIDDEGADASSDPGKPVRPVRPRRVVKSNLAVAAQPHSADDEDEDLSLRESVALLVPGFEDYLDKLGDVSFGDDEALVEAGVAYIAREVGRETVNRPELLQLVLQTNEGMSRENALVAFDKLLADGKLTKVRRGVFSLTEDSRFN